VTGFAANESGATAIEYGLLAALMSIGILTALTSMGSQLNIFFASVVASL
jgi:pilus assembly protein Flp/PilA